jgi:hypothetical protein
MNEHYPGGPFSYVHHPAFAKEPQMYIRGFLLLQKDLEQLFEYIEPSDQNLLCYSFRVYELLLRSCVEVEANCKAILLENAYRRSGNLTMKDYRKIEASHRLSGYEVKLPYWLGAQRIRRPFALWAEGKSLAWYQAYNEAKHNRSEGFAEATLEHAVDAVCAVLVLLSAQFHDEDFIRDTVVAGSPSDAFDYAIGGYFVVRYPFWMPEDRYDMLDWPVKGITEDDPFQNFPYP